MFKTTSVPGFTLRDKQPEIIQRIMDVYNSGKRVVVLQAPTGSGKSIIARTVCTAFQRSYILMPSRALQHQYDYDFRQSGTALLEGKVHYTCAVEDGDISVESAACQSQKSRVQIKECCEKGACPYYSARNQAIDSRDAIMNFAGYLTWMQVSEQMEAPYFTRRQLHVIDEAHRIEDVVCDFLGIKIFDAQLKKMFKHHGPLPDMPREGDEKAVISFLKEVFDVAQQALDQLCTEYDCQNVHVLVERAMELKTIERDVMPIFTLQDKIKRFFESDLDTYAMGFSYEAPRGRMRPGGALVLAKPLLIGNYIREKVMGEYTLFMSATLPMTESWAREMGLSPHDYEVIDIESHFPHENRPVFFTTIGRLSKGEAERKIPEAAKKIDLIAAKFPTEKGMIHTPSYAYNKLLQLHFDANVTSVHRYFFCLSGEDTQQALEKHMESPDPTIIVSPAMREGVDLKDHLARFQVIVKAPYDSLGDPAIFKKMKRNPRWYDARCLTHFMQMLGRPIRHKADYARTYILDEDLWHFLHRVQKDIPGYVLEAFHQF